MEKFTLVIGNKNYSSWSLRPWVLMKYFRIPFSEIQVILGRPDSKSKILQYSPSGKVPVLLHEKVTVFESIAICEYLAENFPQRNLWPAHREARATARSVAAEMHAGFIHLRKACPMNIKARKPLEKRTPDIEKDIERIKMIWQECRGQHKKQGEFLFGAFSIADCMFAPVHFRFQTYGIALDGLAQEYHKTMLNLSVIQEWVEAAIKEPYVIERH